MNILLSFFRWITLLPAGLAAMGLLRAAEDLGVIGTPHWLAEIGVVAVGLGAAEICIIRQPRLRSRIALAALALFLTTVLILGPTVDPVSALDFPLAEALVVPGGERIMITLKPGSYAGLHVAFYGGDGLALISGHAVPGLDAGDQCQALVHGEDRDDFLAVAMEVMGSYRSGQVVSGLPLPERDRVPLAGSGQIREGDAVAVINSRGVAVSIRGSFERRDRSRLIVAAIDREVMGRGSSGAPLLQDGYLVGVMVGGFALRPGLGLFAPAAVVYRELYEQGHFEPGPPAGS